MLDNTVKYKFIPLRLGLVLGFVLVRAMYLLRSFVVFFISFALFSCTADTFQIAVEGIAEGVDKGKEETTISVSAINITPNSNATNPIKISRGYFKQLRVSVEPTNAENKKVFWKFETEVSGIEIDQTGKINVQATVGVNTKVTVIAVSQADNTVTDKAYVTIIQPSPENMITVVPDNTQKIKFPMTINNGSSGTIKHAFAMSQTEITWALWKKVHDWANKGTNTCLPNGKHCYTFATGPQAGVNIANIENQQPMAKVNWHNSIVWCNAYTEWYNAEKKPDMSLTVVYKDSNDIILRDATKKTGAKYDADSANYNGVVTWNGGTVPPPDYPGIPTETGFRLPTSQEWEFTARLRKNKINYVTDVPYVSGVDIGGVVYYFTKGDSASGADEKYSKPVTQNFGWYNSNAGGKTHEVALKNANDLNIFDMSGNLAEWCFDAYNFNATSRILRGGRWNAVGSILRVGAWERLAPHQVSESSGFRVSQSLP